MPDRVGSPPLTGGAAVRSPSLPVIAGSAVGYVRFALAHPDHFRVMYGPHVDFENVAVAERRAAFKILVDAIEACQAAGLAPPADARRIANQAWAYAHGLITLYLHEILHRSIDGAALIDFARDIRAFLLFPRQSSLPEESASLATRKGGKGTQTPSRASANPSAAAKSTKMV